MRKHFEKINIFFDIIIEFPERVNFELIKAEGDSHFLFWKKLTAPP